MRVGCSLSRQQAAFALIIGRRFAGAFVAAPRCGGLAPSSLSSEARVFGAEAGQQPSNRCGLARKLAEAHHDARLGLACALLPA